MSVLVNMCKILTLNKSKLSLRVTQTVVTPVRYLKKEKPYFKEVPEPGNGNAYWRTVHYPKNYTVEPLKYTRLGGRDPKTGRKVCEGIGGGIKFPYHWIKWMRDGPKEGPPKEEKVIKIIESGVRTAHIALVASKDEMKYILATENMKPGDIIKTSMVIPKNPIRPNEGDAYPLGALPTGTFVHNVQLHPNEAITIIHAAGCCGMVKHNIGNKILVQLPSKREIALDPQCMATVGKISNPSHASTPIGSVQRLRELGRRPRSGLWHRKTGRMGRKIKKIKPPVTNLRPKQTQEILRCTLPDIKI